MAMSIPNSDTTPPPVSTQDDTRLGRLPTSNDNSEPPRFDENASSTATRNGNSHGTPQSDEKELMHGLVHRPGGRTRKKWTDEETENLVRGCDKVRHLLPPTSARLE